MRHERKLGKDDWATQLNVFYNSCKLYAVNPKLDVCASYGTNKCAKFYSKQENALQHNWKWSWFCNPPYNDKVTWVEYANDQFKLWGKTGIMLLPNAFTDTECFHNIVYNKDKCRPHIEVYFHKGRIKFEPNGNSPVSGNIWIIWSNDNLNKRRKNYKWVDPN